MGGKDQGGTTEKKREVRLSESRLLRIKVFGEVQLGGAHKKSCEEAEQPRIW